MFDKQYRFTGSHATMVSLLTSVFDEVSKAKLFERNLDVYISAPTIGFLFGRKGKKNSQGDTPNQNIFPEQMIDNADRLKYIFRLIMLLDKEHESEQEKRLDKAFRLMGQDESDMALFDEYVLGGVEVLYEKLIEGSTDPSEYINRLYDFLEDFNAKFNEDISEDDILALCRANT